MKATRQLQAKVYHDDDDAIHHIVTTSQSWLWTHVRDRILDEFKSNPRVAAHIARVEREVRLYTV